MKKIYILFILFSFSLGIQAQLLNSSLDLHLAYGLADYKGSKIVNSDGFMHPSLYVNYQTVQTYSLKGIYDFDWTIDISAAFNLTTAKDWAYPEYNLYEGSTTMVYEFVPAIMIHTPFRNEGWFNRIKLYALAGPSMGISMVQPLVPLVDISSSRTSEEEGSTEKSSDFLFGLNSNLGLEIYLNQSFGLLFSCTYNISRISSSLYTDSYIQRFSVNAGVILKFKYDKQFYR